MSDAKKLKQTASAPDLIKTLAVVAATTAIAAGGFLLLRNDSIPQILTTLIAIVWGVASVVLIFYSLNLLSQLFPAKTYNKIVPYIFVGPAVLILAWYLLIPTARSFVFSFMNKDSSQFVGLDNYKYLFTDRSMLVSIRNTVIWLVCGTAFSVVFGLILRGGAAELASERPLEQPFPHRDIRLAPDRLRAGRPVSGAQGRPRGHDRGRTD